MKSDNVFKITTYNISNLVSDIDLGHIALPDLQRPFVWKDKQVRDLFDSLYKGLPVGLIVLWHINSDQEFKPIGFDKKVTPNHLVIDGQQRLTALYSVIKGENVIDTNYKERKPKISFNPISEEFEVLNLGIKSNPEWINDISDIFNNSIFSFIDNYLKNLEKEKPDLEFDKIKVQENIASIEQLNSYTFSVLELSEELDPEEVSEIFVRINSKGKVLNQSDFIFTLMSIYWEEGRKQLEDFSRDAKILTANNNASSANVLNIQPSVENLLRSIVGYSFLRGRLKYAYLILNGRDFDNKTTSEAVRNDNFEILKHGQEVALNLVYWHDFLSIIQSIGFVNDNLISSKGTIYVTYTLYLLGRDKFQIKHNQLKSIISKWFIFSLLTQRYTGSPESAIEKDLINFRNQSDLIGTLERIINSELTNDFWKITLPQRLETSISNFADKVYTAALIFNDEKILFTNNVKLKDYLSPLINSPKKQVERHHIFPRNYLKNKGFFQREYNQVANMIYIDYHMNIYISDKPPVDYWSDVLENEVNAEEKKFIEENYTKVYDLPYEFWKMDYYEFIEERRKLMANTIYEYFNKL